MALKDALARNGLTSTDTSTSSTNDGGQNGGGTGDNGGTEGNEGGAGASGDAGTGSTSSTSTQTTTPQIDDETLIKTLKERGIEVNNFEEIRTKFVPPAKEELTEEQKQEAENKRKAEARAFALRNNLVTTNTLDDFARESAQPFTEVGYQLWKQERTEGMTAEEIAALDEQELVDEYHDEYSLYAEETDPKRKRKEKQLKSKVDAYLKDKYGKVYSLETEYEAHIADQQLRTAYDSNVSQAVKAIGNTLSFSIKEGNADVPFTFQLPEGALEQATQEFLSDASFTVFGKNKLNAEAITDVIKANLKGKYLDQIISYVAKTHAQNEVVKAAKGRRGIPIEETGANQNVNDQGGTKNPIMKRHLDNHAKQTGAKRVPATV